MRIQRAGATLLVYGGGLKTRAEADTDARRALLAYLDRLAVPGEPRERQARFKRAIETFLPRVAPVGGEGHSAVIEIDLAQFNAVLGTRYE